MPRLKRVPYPLLLLGLVIAGFSLFWLGWRFDNKYTAPRHPARLGITWLNRQLYLQQGFCYPLDAWEFYADRLLTPAELASGLHSPDDVFYIGRYAGFDRGDADAPRYGQATYRMTIRTGSDTVQEYALELPELYSSWNLWVNGQLRQSVGMEETATAAPQEIGLVRFSAADRIEIVVAVRDSRSIYSGMVYPPALGSPAAIQRLLGLRLLFHAAVTVLTGVIAVFCLVLGLGLGNEKPYLQLALLCLAFGCSISRPILQTLGVYGLGWSTLQRLGYYAVFVVIVHLQGRLLERRDPAQRLLLLGGGAVCLSIVVQPFLAIPRAAYFYAYGDLLSLYKWLTASYLLVSGFRALRRHQPGSPLLLGGFSLFAAALVFDRLKPLYEPIYGAWPLETACCLLILCIAALLWSSTLQVHTRNLLLQQRRLLDEQVLQAQQEYALLQQEYVRRTERLLHENRNHLVVLRHYAEADEQEQLRQYLARLLAERSYASVRYTEHPLLDTILGIQFERARRLGIYLEYELNDIAAVLPLSDSDLTAVLMNLLDNACEACQELPESAERWLYFAMTDDATNLSIVCSNALPELRRPKGEGHGYGQRIIGDIVRGCGGSLTVTSHRDSYEAAVTIPWAAAAMKKE